MKPEQQIIAIAEACGWKDIKPSDGYSASPYGIDPSDGRQEDVPDYLSDLNAMHEAEKVFVQIDGTVWGDAWDKYCKELAVICFMAEPPNCLARATAAQRAEAFLKTLGLWK